MIILAKRLLIVVPLLATSLGLPAQEARPPATGSVEGLLVDRDGKPASGFDIWVIGTSQTSDYKVDLRSNEKGRFFAKGLHFGSYVLSPFLGTEDSRYPPGTGAFFDKHLARFTISPGNPAATVKVQLEPPTLIISGIVTDMVSGTPLAAEMEMWQTDDPQYKWVKFGAASTGKYRCWLPAGKAIVLRATAEGYQDFETTIPAITSGVDPVVDIAMVPKKDAKEH